MNEKNWAATLREKFAALFSEKKSRTLFLVGIAGMLLIFLSTLTPMGSTPKTNPSVGASAGSAEDYAEKLEIKLKGIVGSVEGVGRCEVMVTTENGVEHVYAVEESQNVNQVSSYEGDEMRRETQQQNTEQKYIVIDAGGGKKEALLKTERPPTVQGVVVVCEGAGSMVVQERVTQVVATALGIPYSRICVTKISK